MVQHAIHDNDFALLLVESGLVLIAIAVAFSLRNPFSSFFQRIERAAGRLARRQGLACASVAATFLLLRLALLPWFPAPLPYATDDFSFLLAADTFAHGRLANPTPAMWTHFESIHITMHPTYASMYFPAPGLVMAAGKLLFGNPWAGILISGALFCGAICWMLQAWLPPGWALLGGVLAVLRIGLFSYWFNTFTGGATVSGLGGALILGALPRLMRTAKIRYGVLMAVGMVLLATTRPFEGLLICIPVAGVLAHWVLFGKNRPSLAVLGRRAIAPALVIAAGLAFLGYYDYRAFGNAKTLPYTIQRSTYAMVPYYVWQPAHSVVYRNEEMKRFYLEGEAVSFKKLHSSHGFVSFYLTKIDTTLLFFAGMALLLPLIMMPRVFRDRRVRFLAWSAVFWAAGMGLGIYLIPHYLAPFTAGVYALGLQAMRHLRAWKYQGNPVGRSLVRFTAAICLVMAMLRVPAEALHIAPDQFPQAPWLCTWYGPGHFGTERADVAAQLEQIPGNHLVLVRYGPEHETNDEWVYNGADIDHARIIWARAMSPAEDAELIRYYHDRNAWLVQPDREQGRVMPYPGTDRPSVPEHTSLQLAIAEGTSTP
jgi:hypothetical protein